MDPSLPEKIFRRAELEQAHRHDQEKRLVEAQIEEAKRCHDAVSRGQWLGALVALAFGSGAVYLGVNKQPWLGGVLGGATVVGIVTVIAQSRKDARAEKADAQ